MRIVAGEYRSRNLKTLEGNQTRPTLDKVREAVFSHIGPYFDGGCMLDLFSGSGAIALESLSRGYDKAVLVDKNYKAINVIKENVSSLKCEAKCLIWNMDYKAALKKAKDEGICFDMIYLDPPYRFQLISQLCQQIDEMKLLKSDGIIIAESLKEEEVTVEHPFVIEKEAIYGISKISYIVKKGE